MLRNSLLALSIASLSTISPLLAEEKTKGTYFVGSIGAGAMNDIVFSAALGGGTATFDPGFSGEVGIGYDFGTLRTQLTYSSINSDLTKIQGTTVDVGVDVSSFLLEGAIDFREGKNWQPYVGLGVGSSEISVNLARTVGNVNLVVGDDNISSVIGRVGMSYKASEKVNVYAEGWALAFDDFSIGTVEFYDCGMTGASLGLRIRL